MDICKNADPCPFEKNSESNKINLFTKKSNDPKMKQKH
jgi:hypothetical protein